MKNATKGKMIQGFAIFLDVSAPLLATFSQFPLWVEQSSEATMSGLFLVFAFFSILPFLKHLKAFFQSPSVPVIWIILFVLLVALQNIISEMIVVCFAGMIANLIGACIYSVGRHIAAKPDDS